MIYFAIAISILFTVWRVNSPGHAVSAAGSVEAMAHVWMGFVLAWFTLGVKVWIDCVNGNCFPKGAYKWREFPWLLLALWFVPSMIELVLFLLSPFNPMK